MKKHTISIVFIVLGLITYYYGYYTEQNNFQSPPVSTNFSWGITGSPINPSPKSITLKHFGILFIGIGIIISLYKLLKK